MASPATETWWSTFLDAQGRDSEEEAGFVGFLTTNGIPAGADPGTLQEAYSHFRQWMQESEDREADRGPDRATLAAEQAVAVLEQQFVAKSRVSAPGVEKPRTAATRPKETREPLADAPPGPEGEATVASTSEPGASVASPTPAEATPASEARYGRRRSETSEGA